MISALRMVLVPSPDADGGIYDDSVLSGFTYGTAMVCHAVIDPTMHWSYEFIKTKNNFIL